MPRTASENFRRSVRTVCGGLALMGAGAVHALNVFTCEPEWAALVTVLAPQAQVVSATHHLQDPHHIEARPSLIAALRRADLAVCTGAELEAGWLPMLQQRAGNPRVLDQADGMFFASDHVTLMEVSAQAGPFAGDVHAAGNPHFQLDPERLLEVAQGLANTLSAVDPPGRNSYATRLRSFEREWRQHMDRWRAQSHPLRGRTVVAQHSSFAYWWRWLGMSQTADLEPKPGLPPTPGHLSVVLQQARQQAPMAVVATRYQDDRSARWLAERLGQPRLALSLPTTVDSPKDPGALVRLFDTLLAQLLPLTATGKP